MREIAVTAFLSIAVIVLGMCLMIFSFDVIYDWAYKDMTLVDAIKHQAESVWSLLKRIW